MVRYTGIVITTNSFILELGISVEIDMFLDWFWQVDYPHLGKLCSLVIPGSLTALDHWSPQVKVCKIKCFNFFLVPPTFPLSYIVLNLDVR